MKAKKLIIPALTALLAAGTVIGLEVAVDYTIGRKYKGFAGKKGFLGQVSRALDENRERIDKDTEFFNKLPFERVEITSFDGATLVGHFMPAEHPKRTVVFMHGFRSDWRRDFCSAIPFFLQCGCNLLIVEQRAHGESGGDYLGYGILERYDCLEWLKYADCRSAGSLPLYAHGISMGGTTVLLASELELPQNVVGIIADSGFTSPNEIIAHVMKKAYMLPEKPILPLMSSLCKAKAGYGFYDRSTVDALRNNTRPVLLIHGEDDTFVPTEMSRRNYEATAGYKQIITVPGAGHGLSYLVQQKECEKALLDFYRICEG